MGGPTRQVSQRAATQGRRQCGDHTQPFPQPPASGTTRRPRIVMAPTEAVVVDSSATSYGRHLSGGSRDSVGDVQMSVR
jgi:hypothetical protein